MRKIIEYANTMTALVFALTTELVLLRRRVAEQDKRLEEIRQAFGDVRVYTVKNEESNYEHLY